MQSSKVRPIKPIAQKPTIDPRPLSAVRAEELLGYLATRTDLTPIEKTAWLKLDKAITIVSSSKIGNRLFPAGSEKRDGHHEFDADPVAMGPFVDLVRTVYDSIIDMEADSRKD